jgi:type IV pilus assembly protein PilV
MKAVYFTKKQKKDRRAGFTLIEVMVALGILAFGILALAAMQDTALLGTSNAQTITDGTTYAMDRMERLLATPYDTLAVGNDSETVDNYYLISWDVQELELEKLKHIEVSVQWTQPVYGTRTTKITSRKVYIK